MCSSSAMTLRNGQFFSVQTRQMGSALLSWKNSEGDATFAVPLEICKFLFKTMTNLSQVPLTLPDLNELAQLPVCWAVLNHATDKSCLASHLQAVSPSVTPGRNHTLKQLPLDRTSSVRSHSKTPILKKNLPQVEYRQTDTAQDGPAKPGDGLRVKRKGVEVFHFFQFELLPRKYRFPITDNRGINMNYYTFDRPPHISKSTKYQQRLSSF